MQSPFVSVICQILSSAFSGERIVEITTATGHPFIGVVPREYCMRMDGSSLIESEPLAGRPLAGRVAARVIQEGHQTARVAFPDGEVAEVPMNLLADRKPGRAHVPLGS